ncbi:MAG: ATP-binding cassette domain-containing protein [Neomegalonema sp.]|nr:ATP-binding cassette domain-containing protein [Neomegalonema sp.]
MSENCCAHAASAKVHDTAHAASNHAASNPETSGPTRWPDGQLLGLSGVGVAVRGKQILSGVGLSLYAGQIVTIVGPNGGGKTSLLRAVIGDLPLTSGIITRRPGLRIGYVPQKLAIDQTMPLTVSRFLAMSGASSRDTRLAMLERVGAGALAGRQMAALSGGELQRALLARALLRAPHLLLLDEPTQGLDQEGTVGFYRLLETLRREEGVGVLMVSHELHVVMAQSDHVLCLNGHVCCAGEPEAVAVHPEYRRLFGRGDDEVLAVYQHHHDHSHG